MPRLRARTVKRLLLHRAEPEPAKTPFGDGNPGQRSLGPGRGATRHICQNQTCWDWVLLAGLRVVTEDLQNWALLQLYSLVCNLVDSTDCCLLS